MIPTTLGDVARVTGGRLTGPPGATVTAVVTDSRQVTPGALFVAVVGEHVDGHRFAADAVAAGAAGVLATREVDAPAVVVNDVLAALAKLAHDVWSRAALDATVGVTGSSGKTTTKDLMAQVFERIGTTIAPVGSFNNEIGLPLTVCRVDPATRYLVLEMSARGRGHIAALCEIARPDVAVVLNVGTAHVGEFGSRDEIARAKREIVEGSAPGGVAVLNADDPRVSAMAAAAPGRVVRFGESPGADYVAEGVRLDELGRAAFRLRTPYGEAPVALRLVGEHQVSNALAAAAAAGDRLPVGALAAALSEAEPRSRWRMEVRRTPDGVTVLNDAYNANPESMRAALKTLANVGRSSGGRTFAVLGEMKELGEQSWAEHDAIGRLCVRLDIGKLVAVGAGAKGIHAGAGLEGSWDDESVFVEDTAAAVALLRGQLRPGDVVLVKASRSVGLERVALALLGEAAS